MEEGRGRLDTASGGIAGNEGERERGVSMEIVKTCRMEGRTFCESRSLWDVKL